MKKIFSKKGLLYLLLDRKVIENRGHDIFALTDALAAGGVDIFQLRFSEGSDRDNVQWAQRLTKVIRKHRKIIIINNRADCALLANADGVHVGYDDVLPHQVRKILGKNKIVGATVHSLEELELFQREPVDYVSVGPAFVTAIKPHRKPLKPKVLKTLVSRARKPLFAIGGIRESNVEQLMAIGISNVVVCRGILLAQDPLRAMRVMKQCLEKAS